jgi:hypothetical protein
MPLRGFAVYEASNADEAIALLELHGEKIRTVFTRHPYAGIDGWPKAYVR